MIPATVELPDGSRHKLYQHISPNSSLCPPNGTGCYITRDFWVYAHSANPPLLRSPDGTTYTLGYSTSLFIGDVATPVRYPTQIEDPFGNFFNIDYMATPEDGIQSITQDLGGGQVRTVTFTVIGTRKTLSTMSYIGATTHTWTYTQVDANSVGYSRLTEVRPPIGPSWRYQYDTVAPVQNELIGITTPQGGQIDYTYADKDLRLGSNVQAVTTRSVVQRSVSGRGVTAGTWTFAYALGTSENQGRITSPSPCGTMTTTFTFMGVGNYSIQGNVWKIGLLESKVVADGGGSLETENVTWTPSALISNDIETVGFNQDVGISVALVSTRTLTRGGQNYATTNTYSTNASNFNDYGRPYQIDENGDLTGTRQTSRTFQYGFGPYIVDRIASETVTVTGSQSFQKSYQYNLTNGFKTSQTVYGITTSYTPTSTRGNIASSTNNSNTTTYSYDWGLASTITTPMYPITRVINREGTIDSETRQYWNGISNQTTMTSFQYDAAFRPTRRTPQVGNFIATSYDNAGGEWVQVARGPSWTKTNLDGLGRSVGTLNSVGIQTRIDYDACGRKSYESYPQAGTPETTHGTSYSYDALDRVTRRTNNADNPDSFVGYAYGPGLQVVVTDENSHPTTQGWKAFGDPSDARLMSVTEANGRRTDYTYNTLGSLTRVTQPGTLPPRTWTYFATTGLLQQETHPESGIVSYTYDPAGNVETRTDFRAGHTTYGYDGNNRLTSITRPAGFTDYNTTFQYDGSDQRKLAQNSYVSSNFAYDAARRLVKRTDTVNGRNFITDYVAYDGNDNLQQLNYPSGTQVIYSYDSENRISAVGKPGTPTFYAGNFNYHPSGAVSSFKPGGSNPLQQFTYDDRYRLRDLNTGARHLTYDVYDAVGNVSSILDARPNMNRGFTHDALDRVVTASGYWGQSKSFVYDDLGNRTFTSVGSSVTFSYNPTTNRLASYTGSGTLGYDAGGNTTADGIGGTYTYTADNMVRTATVGGTTTTYYYYDGDNLRTRKLDPSGVNHYYLHGPGNQILSEFGDPCVGQPPLPVRDYVYAAGRLLASVQAAAGINTVGLTAAAGSVGEATGPAQVSVRVSTSSPSGTVCPITVSHATANGTALAGIDYTATSGTLSFPVGTANGTMQAISVPVTNDALDEDDETFSVSLSNANGATLVSPSVQTVTIADDDPPPSISINDVSVVEGDTGSLNAIFTISLSAASSRSITVDAATANGTAVAGSDYTTTSVTGLVFAPGLVSRTVAVPVLGDTTDEPNETFYVNLANPTNATVGDAQGVGTITDNDAPPALSIGDVTIREGDEGTGNIVFTVTMSAPSGWTVTANYATANGTATAGSDYASTSGLLSMSPGSTTGTLAVPVFGDGTNETDETFFLNLSNPSNATLADAQAVGVLTNDDPVPVPAIELSHGSAQLRSLTQPDPASRQDWYRLGQKPYSSYEIVVDSTSVNAVSGLDLQRLAHDAATVLQSAVPIASGLNLSRSLRWENATSAAVNGHLIRVRNGSCAAPCTGSDIYRIRTYETTYSIARLNNTGTQTTIVMLQNPQPYAIAGTVWFWDSSGNLLGSYPFTMPSKAVLGIDTQTVAGVAGQSGSITVSNNGRYGDLSGKAVHLDPETGFTFDTPLVPWPR
jgi:YD repeat-containing protein